MPGILMYYAAVIGVAFLLPFIFLQCTSNKKSLSIGVIVWAIATLWLWQHNWDHRYEDDRLGTGDTVFALLLAAGIIGIPLRMGVLVYRLKKTATKFTWSRQDNIFAVGTVTILLIWQILNFQDICIPQMRRLSDDEIIKRYEGPYEEGREAYISLGRGRSRSILGTMRRPVTLLVIPDKNSAEIKNNFGYALYFEINACGIGAGSDFKEDLSKKDIEKQLQNYRKLTK